MSAAQYRAYSSKIMDEQAMISAVVSLLNLHGYVAWRQENSGQFNTTAAVDSLARYVKKLLAEAQSGQQMELFQRKTKADAGQNLASDIHGILSGCWRKVPNSVRGVADVIGWERGTGRWIAVEIKVGSDQLSLDQKVWLESLRQSGGDVWVCRDFVSFSQAFLQKKRAM
jgi:VRR-NUC domain